MRLGEEDSGDERDDGCAAAVLGFESNERAAEDVAAAAAAAAVAEVELEESGRFVAGSPSNSWSSFNSQMR